MSCHPTRTDQPTAAPPEAPDPRPFRLLVYLAALLVLFLAAYAFLGGAAVEQISYVEFRQRILANQVAEVILENQHVRGRMKEAAGADGKRAGRGAGRAMSWFATRIPEAGDASLLPTLAQAKIRVRVLPTAAWMTGLYVLPWLLLASMLLLAFRYTSKTPPTAPAEADPPSAQGWARLTVRRPANGARRRHWTDACPAIRPGSLRDAHGRQVCVHRLHRDGGASA